MPRIKLTKAQQAMLDAINQGATARYMPYNRRHIPTPYWWLNTTHQRCTKQVNRLIALGLVQVIASDKYLGYQLAVARQHTPA